MWSFNVLAKADFSAAVLQSIVYVVLHVIVGSYITSAEGITIATSSSGRLPLETYSYIDGDVIIGALLPIRGSEDGLSCHRTKESALVWVDSLHYAVAEINSNSNILTNVSLGIEVRDTCSEKISAPHQALDFVRGARMRALDSNASREKVKPIIGVITESPNKEVLTLLEMFNVPHISFAEQLAHDSLKETVSFGSVSFHFYRALALIDLIKSFKNWSSVSVVYSNRLHGGFKTFEKLAGDSEICLSLRSDLDNLGINSSVSQLLSEAASSVVVLFSSREQTLQLFTALKSKLHGSANRFTWLMAGAWFTSSELQSGGKSTLPRGLEDIADGALIIEPVFPFLEEMNNFYRRNPAKSETFSKNNMDLKYSHLKDECTENATCRLLRKGFWTPLQVVWAAETQAVVNSVALFAKVLDNLVKTTCVSKSLMGCNFSIENVEGWRTIEELERLQTSFYRSSAERFPEQKDLKENAFTLMNFHKNGNVEEMRIVGTWERGWFINTDGIKWRNGSLTVPESSCGITCPEGYIRVSRAGCECCWSCSKCNYNQIVKNNYLCVDCERGYWPSDNLKTCEFKLTDVLLKGFFGFVTIVCVFFLSVL